MSANPQSRTLISVTRSLENREREDVFLRVLRTLDSPLEVAGRRRKERWEEGWRQNLCEFIESGYDLAALVPKFVRRNEVIRLEGNYIQPADPNFENQLCDSAARMALQEMV